MDGEGRSRSLALWWKLEIDIELQSFSKRHVDVLVRKGLGEGACYIIGFYGNPRVEDREELW